MKTLNNELYNFYNEQLLNLSKQLDLFELCELDCSKIIERIMQYSKARDRAFNSLYIDNDFTPPNLNL